MSAGRVMAVDGHAQDVLIDFELWRRDSLRDRVVTDREALLLVPIALRMARRTSELARTVGMVRTLVSSEHGVDSPKAMRRMKETHRPEPDANEVA